jgi:TrmH family RNA methyltransferase
VLELFCTEGADVRHPDLVAEATRFGIATHVVTEHVAAALSEARSSQGVVAVCAMPQLSLPGLLARRPNLLVVLVDVADPGNAGTVIRVADAAGADGVVFAGSTVDPYNGKCVRASTGSIVHLPVVTGVTAAHAVRAVRDAGLIAIAADSHAPTDIDAPAITERLARPTAWLFGHEVRGLASVSELSVDVAVRIPIYGSAESLNLATAAAVCLYASASRQRRSAGG